jgi:phosphodiesterase/alkaline phosphatase D-like protein
METAGEEAMTRRELMGAAAGAALAQDLNWNAGAVQHLLPAANHNRFRVKASFTRPLAQAPRLSAGGALATASKTDTAGEFWSFDIGGLKPGTGYQMELTAHDGKPLCDPWPLRTFPHPNEPVNRFRLMVYTCAGGHDSSTQKGTTLSYFVPIAQRRKLLAAGLAQRPDAVVAIGDHIYWDLRFGRGQLQLPPNPGGDFERNLPVIGTGNEARLKFAATNQIAGLYGTLFRSTPTHFIQDDHDYYENDEAHQGGISFPPDDFMMRLARATQRLYYPEFLPMDGRPDGLPNSSPSMSESYGTLRFGTMAELLLYDCRRNLTLKGPFATLVPEVVENWLLDRMKRSPAKHVVNVPSMPIAWTAGKWLEWYPDVLDDAGRLGVAKEKYFWQPGWRAQHDRLLTACSAMPRIPLFLSGDLHALAHGRIHRAGSLDLRRNPVVSVLTGPVSTGPKMWPSSARGTPPGIATGVELEERLKPLEDNGFTIADFLEDRIEFQMFHWKLGRDERLLDRMEAFHRFTLTST